MKIPIYQVDAFADKVFGGNPAAVCPLNGWISDEIMQQIAMENNLSETAFFVDTGDHFEIRWFTPKTEVDLCGHATLASAHVLYEHLNVEENPLLFECAKGQLKVSKRDSCLEMDFPSTFGKKTETPEILIEALGLPTKPIEAFKADDYMLIVDEQEQIAGLNPDFSRLKKIDTRGIIITATGNDVDFVSRFFAPAVGIDEDPVTGSAHTMLAPYWAKKLNKRDLSARQLSARGGNLRCTFNDERTVLAGNAVTYSIGEIYI